MIWYMLRTLVGARRVPWEGRGGGQVARFDQGIGYCRLSGVRVLEPCTSSSCC